QYPGKDKGASVWRLSQSLGYGAAKGNEYPARLADAVKLLQPRVMLIDDGGLGFRFESAKACWPPDLAKARAPAHVDWVVLKMSGPLVRGDLWRQLTSVWRDRLIVVVAADSLRREAVGVSRG